MHINCKNCDFLLLGSKLAFNCHRMCELYNILIQLNPFYYNRFETPVFC